VAVHQMQGLLQQVQQRDGPGRVFAVLFEYGQVLLLIVDAVSGLDNEPIGLPGACTRSLGPSTYPPHRCSLHAAPVQPRQRRLMPEVVNCMKMSH
jgi:hypothetical protein